MTKTLEEQTMKIIETLSTYIHDELIQQLADEGVENPEEELRLRKEKHEQKQIALKQVEVCVVEKWKNKRNANHQLELDRAKRADIINTLLNNGSETKQVKPTKTFLNKLIQWSSSRYNEYWKADVVDYVKESIEQSNIHTDLYCEYTSGCYSDGSHGHGKNKVAFFKCKWTGGTYRLVIVRGLPYLILGSDKSSPIVMFDNFSYPERIPVDQVAINLELQFKAEVEAAVEAIELQFGQINI